MPVLAASPQPAGVLTAGQQAMGVLGAGPAPLPDQQAVAQAPVAQAPAAHPSAQAPVAAPQAQPAAPPAPCKRCGNAGLMTGVTLVTASGDTVQLQLRDGTRTVPTATICSSCGDVSVTADTQHIFQALSGKA